MFCVRVKKVIRHGDRISTLVFDRSIPSYPGQFLMVNVFGKEEIPLSLSSDSSVTVKAVGDTTRELVNFERGRILGIRGPFGRPFSPSRKALIIAGGIGIAPLRYLYLSLREMDAEVKVIFGARTSDELIWVDEFEDVEYSTDDGSRGIKGTVLDLLRGLNLSRYDRIYCCGPEPMMRKVCEVLSRENLISRAEFSFERYIRCGIGVCGSCVVRGGVRVCREGPVIPGPLALSIYTEGL